MRTDRPSVVLVVDDSEGVCAALSMLLEDAGFETKTASSYQEALQALETESFDLVLIDAQLGVYSGIKLATELLSLRPESKIVLMTGSDVTEGSFSVSGLPVLQKPFSRQELLDCLKRAMQQAAWPRVLQRSSH